MEIGTTDGPYGPGRTLRYRYINVHDDNDIT